MRSFFLLLALTTSLCAEEIVVNLSANSTLEPLYLEITGPAPYTEKVASVLRFDLDHNGKTRTTAKKGTSYSVKGSIENNSLSVSTLEKSGKSKKFEAVALSGNLSEDRRKIHRLADAIFESFFHSQGVASSRVLYTVRVKNGEEKDASKWKTEVWESDYDGENARPLTQEKSFCVNPVYLPKKGEGFLYVTYKTGQSKIYCVMPKGKKKVSQIRGNQLMPAINSKGNLVAFVCDATGNPEIFLQRFTLGDSEEKPWQITSAPNGAQGSPTFSPDGKKIAYVSNKDGTPRIYMMDVPQPKESIRNIKPQLLTKSYRDNTSPAWSPDGKKLAYCALAKGVRQIFLYDFATKKETQLTQGAGHKENPAWAHNSEHLLYDRTDASTSDLYLIHCEQKDAVKISKGSGEKRFPAWTPYR